MTPAASLRCPASLRNPDDLSRQLLLTTHLLITEQKGKGGRFLCRPHILQTKEITSERQLLQCTKGHVSRELGDELIATPLGAETTRVDRAERTGLLGGVVAGESVTTSL